jgi:hypothetical protein
MLQVRILSPRLAGTKNNLGSESTEPKLTTGANLPNAYWYTFRLYMPDEGFDSPVKNGSWCFLLYTIVGSIPCHTSIEDFMLDRRAMLVQVHLAGLEIIAQW